MSLDALDVDSLLRALSYLGVQGLARTACGNRLGAVAAHEAQQRPVLLVLKGSPDEVARDIREKLRARPTLAFLQYSSDAFTHEDRGAEMLQFVRKRLPRDTKVLGAQTDSLQCALFRDQAAKAGTVLEVCSGEDGQNQIALLLATLPEAAARVYHVRSASFNSNGNLDGIESSSDGSGIGSEEPEDEESEMDEEDVSDAFGPRASWDEVGGDQAQDGLVEPSGIVGVPRPETGNEREGAAIEGATPLAQAANWLSSLPASAEQEAPLEPRPARAQAASDDASLQQDGSDPLAELLALDPPPQVIVVHLAGRMRNLVQQLQAAYPQAAVIGGVVMGEEVLTSSRGLASAGNGVGVMAIMGNAPIFTMTSPFSGNSRSAQEDVRRKLLRAQELATAKEREILGTLLFTCAGRGHRMFGREANDAILFQERFPLAPLLGYYAGGEIGPKAHKDGSPDAEDEFLTGNACEQGFTAVFGFFLVPRKHIPSLQFHRAVLHGEVREAFKEIQCVL